MKKLGIIFALALIIGITVAFLVLKGKEFVLRIPENDLRSKMEEKLPFTKTYLLIFSVTLSNPRVDLIDGTNRVNAGLDVRLNIKFRETDREFGGKVDISGGIQYNPDTGEFYLLDPVIENLSIQGIPDKHINKANSSVSKALGAYYKDHPIYTLRSTDVKKATARLLLKSVIVENEELVVTLGI